MLEYWRTGLMNLERRNHRRTILGGGDDGGMGSDERRGHDGALLLASLRDAVVSLMATGGVAALNHRLMALNPSGSRVLFPHSILSRFSNGPRHRK